MKSLKFKLLFILIFLAVFNQCEKDDICISTIVGNPDMVILMLDIDSGSRSTPPGFFIRPIGTEKKLSESSGDSLKLPLKLTQSITQFEFLSNIE